MSTLHLNGFQLSFSSPDFSLYQKPFADNNTLREFRKQHEGWFTHWKDGIIYAIPIVDNPTTAFGDPQTVAWQDHLQLLAARIDRLLPQKFPDYEAFVRKPFSFLSKKAELVEMICKKLGNPPHALRQFTIRPHFRLEAKIIESHPDQPEVGLFLNLSTRSEIKAPLSELKALGVSLEGLYLVRRKVEPGQRRSVGRIVSIADNTIHLEDSYDNLPTIQVDEVFLEGSKTNFKRCLSTLLTGRYEAFEDMRRNIEADLLNGPAIQKCLERFHSFFQKDPDLPITSQLTCRIGNQLILRNTPAHNCIHRIPPVSYVFDPARSKTSPYPWVGIQNYGPFSRDTFAKRSPSILVVFPDDAQGKTETFLKYLQEGVNNVSGTQHYPGGLGKLFALANPTFTLCRVPMPASGNPTRAYKDAIVNHLAAATKTPDAALVILHDQHGKLPDDNSPYLTAKALLLVNGIPTQEMRISKITQKPYDLQFILQDISIALYAKMNGTPWTVNQDTTISDELVIGLGNCEIRNGRSSGKERFVGITTVFRGDGNYLLGQASRECTYEEYPAMLLETTTQVLKEVKQRNGWNPGDNVRVIFHTYKPLKNVEIAAIAKQATDTVGDQQTIEFAFLTVTSDHPFILIDQAQKGIQTRNSTKGQYAPERGTIVQIGRYTRALSVLGPRLIRIENSPLPTPLLIHLHRESTFRDLTYLSEQVLKFTGLSWRSSRPARRPVTILYSDLIAELLARLRNVPGWSTNTLNTKLRASKWFL